MKTIKVNDVLSDCIVCEEGKIVYGGHGIAACNKCGGTFNVEPDTNEQFEDDIKVNKKEKVIDPLLDVSIDKKSAMKQAKLTSDGVPAYIARSRPWKRAQRKGQWGNPYTEGCKAHYIFESIASLPMLKLNILVDEVLEKYKTIGSIFVVYETVLRCVQSGLMKWDEKTGYVSVIKPENEGDVPQANLDVK